MARALLHPGPPVLPRREAVAARLRPVEGVLRPGEVVMDGVARLMAEAGCVGGVLRLSGGHLAPFRYVLPAASNDGIHAAWYSETHAPDAGGRIAEATAIVGRRDGAPFLHCHGRWDTCEAVERMGHMLPFDCTVAEPIAVTGLCSAAVLFEGLPDEETAFTLFTPRSDGAAEEAGRRGLFLRLRPNEDVCGALEAAAAAAGLPDAEVLGIGSINEVVFDDGRRVSCHATEIAIEEGRIEAGRARLDVSVVDIAGAVHRGRLVSGDNPVGVTFELVIAAAEESGP